MEMKQILKFCIKCDVLLVASEEFDVVRFLSFTHKSGCCNLNFLKFD